MTGSVLAGDPDPRPEPGAGEQPAGDVPVTKVDALPCDVSPEQNHVAPAGNWISHEAGWTMPADASCEGLIEFLDQSPATFTIRGEEFVLDGADDWDIDTSPDDPTHGCRAGFSYVTPPERPGLAYDFRWEQAFLDTTQEISVVKRRDAVSDCTGEDLTSPRR